MNFAGTNFGESSDSNPVECENCGEEIPKSSLQIQQVVEKSIWEKFAIPISRIILLGNDFFKYLMDFDDNLGIYKLAHQKNA